MDESRETSPKQPARETPTRTYSQLVWRDFRSNYLAMTGLVVIFFVITVAVLCPFLANNRPLYIEAEFPFDYFNSLQVVIEQVSLAAEGETPENTARTFRENIADLKEHLGPERADLIEEVESGYRQHAPPESEEDREALRALSVQLDPLFDAELQPVKRYPALRALRTGEVFSLLVYLLAACFLVFRRRIRHISIALAAVLIPALAGTAVWKTLYPTIQDTRDYRSITESEDFAEQDWTVLYPLIPFGENENIIAEARQAPTWALAEENRVEGQNWHWLGTDTNGRDVLARMVYGARVSMLVGIVAVSIYTIIGIIVGAVAGFFRGWVDMLVSRVIEIVICFPPLILILAVQAFLAPSLMNIILALAALWWTAVARLQRGEFLRLVNMDYVVAVRALGGSNLRIIFLHVLPNGIGPVLVLVSFGIAGSILIESGLSFLGFGVPQPMASWGDLLNNGRNDIQGLWWLTVFPGLAIFLTVTCFNLIGEGVRDALDPVKER